MFVGNYDPEFNMVMLKNTEEGKPYHYELTKAFTQSLIGQYSLDQYHENMVIFSDEFFEERWQEVRRDKTKLPSFTCLLSRRGKERMHTQN